MPTGTTQAAGFSAAQFHALFAPPIAVPTPEEVFAHCAERYLALNLGVPAEVDRVHDVLPPTGISLPVFRKFLREEFNDLMALVVVNDKRGRNYLDLAYLTDELWVPDGPHMLTDVRDGRNRLNVKPSISHANIASEGRKGHAAIHLIHWGLYFGKVILTHHNLDGLASAFRSEHVPHLYLYNGRPQLHANWIDYADQEWGAPCCGSVVVSRT